MPTEIFGRDAELRTIAAFLDVLAHSAGSLVLAGPAGAGKTTLLRAGAAMAAERGFTVLRTMPAPGDVRLAFAGLADLLEPCLEAVSSELPSPQARALRMALLLADAPAHPPEPRAIATAFRSAVGLLARSAPVLVVIDDVQWLDPPSEEAVGFAVRRLEHEAAGLLCAQRTSRPGAELPLELDRALLHADLLPVGGLSLGALHRMLRTRLGTSLSHQTLRRIETDSGGNPFIALEIGRALARRGVTSAGAGGLPVPGTLSGLVGERLGELPPAVLDTVRLVAVLPDAPFEQYLAAGAGGAELDTAVLAGVLEPDGGRLRFSHPLLASAVAGSIPPASLRELHGVAARVVRLPEEQARHRALAATGPSAPVAAELDDAGRAAAGQGAPATAAELFGLAAALTPAGQPADAFRRRLAAARQLAVAGETRAAITSLEQLIASMPPGPERARALSQLGWLRDDDVAAAAGLLDQALAEAGDDRVLAAGIHLGLSDISMLQGSLARGRGEALKAVADADRTGDPALIGSSLAHLFFCNMICGAQVDERQLQRALEAERIVGSVPLRSPPSGVAGIWHLTQGRLDEAEAELRKMLALADAHGAEYSRADALLRLSLVAGRRADAGQAAELAAAGLEITEQLDAAAGELTEALRLQDLLSPQPLERGRTLLVLGGVRRRMKQRSSARAALSEAIGIFDAVSAPLWAARARTELARVSGRAPGPDDFTVTERRVTELVARGMTNREVAAELFVTVRAVESTLTKAYAKLGVRSRTELAARLHKAG